MLPSFQNEKRFECLARSLRLLASGIEISKQPTQVREVLFGLEEAATLLRMCLYENQTQLIANAQYDLMAEGAR